MSADEKTGFIFGDQWPERHTVIARTPPERDRGFTPGDLGKWMSRQFAGVAAIVAGVFSGMATSQQTMIQSVETASGEAMVFGQPGPAFWWMLGFLGVATLLMMYAVGVAE